MRTNALKHNCFAIDNKWHSQLRPRSAGSRRLGGKFLPCTKSCLTAPDSSVTRCNATMTSVNKKRPKGLGEVEQMIMELIWDNGPCSAESCREALAATRPMKESTVRTILRRLEQKGFVTHETEGRTYVYRALEARQNVAVRAVRNIIDRFCGGSAEELVIGMVNSAVIDREQLEVLARRIARGKAADLRVKDDPKAD